MSTVETGRVEPVAPAATDTRATGVAAGGSFIEALAGIAVVVLAILGLAGVATNYFIPISVIVVGVALVFQGLAAMGRRMQAMSDRGGGGPGLGGEFLAGFAGIVLGILALIGVAAGPLLSTAILVFGVALILTSLTTCSHCASETAGAWGAGHDVFREAAMAAASAQAMVGVAAVVLGILALVGFVPPTLQLVALLILGAALVLSGGALGGKMVSMMRR